MQFQEHITLSQTGPVTNNIHVSEKHQLGNESLPKTSYCQELKVMIIISVLGLTETTRYFNAGFQCFKHKHTRVHFCAQCKHCVTCTLLGCGRSKRGSCGCREISALLMCSENWDGKNRVQLLCENAALVIIEMCKTQHMKYAFREGKHLPGFFKGPLGSTDFFFNHKIIKS